MKKGKTVKKQHSTKKATKAKFCSPSSGKGKKDITCFSKESLLKIAKEYNNTHDKPHISVSKSRTKTQIWNDIRSKLSDRCNTEWCWVDQDFVKNIDDDIQNTFRPKMPETWKSNPNQWLTTSDINYVMKQYEKKYKDFIFFGPVPADCPNGILCELSNLNLSKMYKNNKTKIGIVFNLDKHNEPGSHWVALYVDMKKGVISYFDSYGNPPAPLIQKYMEELYYKLSQINNKTKMRYSKTRYQYGNSECGVFSMIYLIHSIQNKKLNKKIITDKTMTEIRKYLYRH